MNGSNRHRFVPPGLAAAWDRASRRERRIVAAGAIVVALAVAWGLVWQPLRADIVRTQDERVRIGTLLAQTRASFEDGAGLARATPKEGAVDLRGAVARALGDHGIRVAPGSIDLRDNRAHVVLSDVRFDALVAGLAALARDDGIRAVDATLTARVDPGTVRAELTFAR
jgi:type II secretory pathway component PulM